MGIKIYLVGYIKDNVTGDRQAVWMTEPEYDDEGQLKRLKVFVERVK